MKITIHRGINQIGGCITEISTEKTKIFIDLGHNLPKGDKPVNDTKANKETIKELTKDCKAIFYTHYHGDHIDLYKFVPDTIPQYIGEVAKQVMLCKSKALAIDRLASFHEASKKCGKSFFCDTSQKEMLDIFSRTASPLYRMYWRGTHPTPNKILDLETIYEIEHIEIFGTGTIVKLVGFGEETFLGGLFEPVDRNESINN